MSEMPLRLIYGLNERETGVDREYFALVGPLGAVEMWRRPSVNGEHYGGIEVHSKVEVDYAYGGYDACYLTGGKCWADGSSLAFHRDGVNHTIAEKDWYGARIVLAAWYRSRFGARALDSTPGTPS